MSDAQGFDEWGIDPSAVKASWHWECPHCDALLLECHFTFSWVAHDNDLSKTWPAFSVTGQFLHKQAGILPIDGRTAGFGHIYTLSLDAQCKVRVANLRSCRGISRAVISTIVGILTNHLESRNVYVDLYK